MRFIAICGIGVLLGTLVSGASHAQEREFLGHLDVGPGLFTSLAEDTTSAETSGVKTYLGFGVYPGAKLSVATRLYFTQVDRKAVETELWGYLTFYPGTAGQPGAYLSVGIGTGFNSFLVSTRGGYQMALFRDSATMDPLVLLFLEAEGMLIDQGDVDSSAQANLGLRGNWGRR